MKSNTGINIGHSARLGYDNCYYPDRLQESVGPLGYRINPISRFNCKQCLSTLGPRTSYQGNSVSTYVDHPVATSQKLVDIESILSNRNVKESKCKNGNINFVNVTDADKFRMIDLGICNDFLNPLSSKLSYPSANYRDMAVNRFYNLNQNPQEPIFWNFAINSTLEAKDNFAAEIPIPKKDRSLPTPLEGKNDAPYPVYEPLYCPKN